MLSCTLDPLVKKVDFFTKIAPRTTVHALRRMSRLGDYRFVNHVALWLMHRGLPAHKGVAPILEKALEEQMAASSDPEVKEGLHVALRVIRGEDHQSNTTANQKKLEYAKKHLPLDFFVTPFLAKHWKEIPKNDKELTKVRAQEDVPSGISVSDAVEFDVMLLQLKTSVIKLEQQVDKIVQSQAKLEQTQAKLEQVLEVPQLTVQVQELTKAVSSAKSAFGANEDFRIDLDRIERNVDTTCRRVQDTVKRLVHKPVPVKPRLPPFCTPLTDAFSSNERVMPESLADCIRRV